MLHFYMLESEAWRSLSLPARSAFVEIARRFNGTNNGRIGMSGRQLATLLHTSRATATRALQELAAKGFIEVVRRGAFSNKFKLASEWRLTIHRCDVTGEIPSKAFMKWRPEQNKTRAHLEARMAS